MSALQSTTRTKTRTVAAIQSIRRSRACERAPREDEMILDLFMSLDEALGWH